ncbi:MAG: RagB/SusD family nutrient uptake outer membrane protein [Bacteroidales bacterium]|nr:RagB/SusD family nutrient uptake outer membrane protein [Bacteroidales bacterium]
MKKISNILLVLSAGLTLGCTNLDENVYSGVALKNFFRTEEELVANAGRAYTKLQGYTSEQSLWTLLLQASDECAVPACGGAWYSNGRYEEVQTNVIPPSNKLILKGWNWIFNGIAACNEIIYETELSEIEFDGKDKILSEIEVLRDFYYYEAISNWGNVPFTIDYTETGYPKQKSRKEVFDYLVQNINDNIDNLDEEPSSDNYGRITKAAAYTILAKLYLNADSWFGTPEYSDAAAACKKIIDAGYYGIEDNYETNFDVDNEKSTENIFCIVYDHVYTDGYDNAFYLNILTLEAASNATFNISAAPWSGFICQPDFFQSYSAADKRRSESWLYGEQYDIDGNDLSFEYEPVFDEAKYYNSNGGRGTYDGARCWKWHYQTDGALTSYDVSMDNDFPVFRYADVVLMYVEALVRQGKTSEAVQLDDFQKIRTRAGLEPYTAAELTLDELYTERGRELAWEGWRHEDMIRFGKYLQEYWAHPSRIADDFRTLFPIPTSVLNANPNLTQNTGY